MSEHDETITELGTTVSYIHDYVTEQADRLDFEDAVRLRDAALAVAEEAKAAVAMIETQMLVHLEAGAVTRGNQLFKRKRNTVKRFRHDLIAADVARYARLKATDDNGVTSVAEAIDATMVAMRGLYVSPSTQAKVGTLDNLGIDRGRVTELEDKGWKLEVEVLDERCD